VLARGVETFLLDLPGQDGLLFLSRPGVELGGAELRVELARAGAL